MAIALIWDFSTQSGDHSGLNGLEDQAFMMLFGFTGFDVLSKAPDRKAPREIPEAEEITGW
jgi:hypothetical protein